MTDPFFFPFPFQKNVHSTRFVTYFCEHVLPNLSTLTSPVAELDIQLEVGKKKDTYVNQKQLGLKKNILYIHFVCK